MHMCPFVWNLLTKFNFNKEFHPEFCLQSHLEELYEDKFTVNNVYWYEDEFTVMDKYWYETEFENLNEPESLPEFVPKPKIKDCDVVTNHAKENNY